MKVIFVDMDGVMLDEEYINHCLDEYGYDPSDVDELNPRALSLLSRLTQETGATTVITSTWRWDEQAYIMVKYYFDGKKIPIAGTTTLVQYPVLSRTEEIALYLSEHPEITNYVILDDEEIDSALLKPHHVRTTLRYGFTLKDYEQAKKIMEEN